MLGGNISPCLPCLELSSHVHAPGIIIRSVVVFYFSLCEKPGCLYNKVNCASEESTASQKFFHVYELDLDKSIIFLNCFL